VLTRGSPEVFTHDTHACVHAVLQHIKAGGGQSCTELPSSVWRHGWGWGGNTLSREPFSDRLRPLRMENSSTVQGILEGLSCTNV